MPRSPKSRAKRPLKHSPAAPPPAVFTEDDLYIIVDNLAEPPFLLLLDGVQDPHNLGAVLRTAAAAGVQAVIAPKDRSVGITETVRRVASGGAEIVPFIPVTNLARTMRTLKEMGVWLVGTSHEAAKSIYEINLSGPLGIVMGSEGFGQRQLTTKECDFLAKIPMPGQMDNLNVSVATGICLFEAVRQRLNRPV